MHEFLFSINVSAGALRRHLQRQDDAARSGRFFRPYILIQRNIRAAKPVLHTGAFFVFRRLIRCRLWKKENLENGFSGEKFKLLAFLKNCTRLRGKILISNCNTIHTATIILHARACVIIAIKNSVTSKQCTQGAARNDDARC